MQYNAVDIVKFVLCLFVVALHCNVGDFFDVNMRFWIEKGLFRLAVPFFFITSGFLLGKKIQHETDIKKIKQVFIKYTKRLLQILLIFEPISILLDVMKSLYDGVDRAQILKGTLKEIVFYPGGALWFVQACIVAVWVIYLFLRFNLKKLIVPSAVVLYLFALICNSYSFTVEGTGLEPIVNTYLKFAISARNGVFVGFPFIYLGISVVKLEDCSGFFKSRTKLAICAIGSYILYLAELYVLQYRAFRDDRSQFITLPLFMIFLLLFCLSFKTYGNTAKYLIYRNLSTGIYLLHAPVVNVLKYTAVLVLHVELNVLLHFVCSVAIAASICLITYRSKNKFIRNLLK